MQIDAPCIGCRYNLRTLPVTGRCPECGRPVADSTRSSLLRFARHAYVYDLSGGAYVLALASLLLLVPLATLLLPSPVRDLVGDWGMALLAACGVVLVVAVPVSLILIVTPDPNASEQSLDSKTRRVVILNVGVALGFGCLLLFAAVGGSEPFLALAGIGGAITALLVPASVLRHTAALTRRLPDDRLERRIRVALTLWLVGGAALVCIPILGYWLPALHSEAGVRASVVIATLMLFGLGLVMYLAGRAFSAAGREAEAHAAQQQAEATTQPPPADQPGAGA